MSTLERRCWLLLTAYPAEYRRERGEEILGTLLETTPQGRGWPLARDVVALIIGGLRARAAANRRLSTAADIRLGVLLGIAMQLSAFAASRLPLFVTSSAVFGTARETAASGWRELIAGLLTAAAVMCAWHGRRRLLVACAPVAAVAVIWLLIHQPAYDSGGYIDWTLLAGEAGVLLLCLAALMLLVRQTERPSRSWLWLIGLIVATGILPGLVPGHLRVLWWPSPVLPLAILIVPIVWIAIDARPALALATYLALEVVTIFGNNPPPGNTPPLSDANYLTAVLARAEAAEAWWYLYAIPLYVGGLALWRLRRRRAAH
jgi:hypothetical protein